MKYHLLSIMLLFSVFVVYGQGWNEAMIYPPSSEAFAQSRLTETQLEPSGNFSYSLPLYTINTKDISLPISLDYTSGVKVNDLGGVVGMGWNLSSGGVISRVMRGLPDEDHVRYIPNYSEIWQENPAELKRVIF